MATITTRSRPGSCPCRWCRSRPSPSTGTWSGTATRPAPPARSRPRCGALGAGDALGSDGSPAVDPLGVRVLSIRLPRRVPQQAEPDRRGSRSRSRLEPARPGARHALQRERRYRERAAGHDLLPRERERSVRVLGLPAVVLPPPAGDPARRLGAPERVAPAARSGGAMTRAAALSGPARSRGILKRSLGRRWPAPGARGVPAPQHALEERRDLPVGVEQVLEPREAVTLVGVEQ